MLPTHRAGAFEQGHLDRRPDRHFPPADWAKFFGISLKDPLRIGAQFPSGRFLADAMAAAVDPDLPGFVVELGVGTGSVTAALLRRGINPERLVLVENEPQFCELLHRRYPATQILPFDAFRAVKALRQGGIGPIAAVVSGLPLLTYRPTIRQRLLLESLRLMGRGGTFIQFTYFYRSPIPIGSGLVWAKASPLVLRNVWPARVWQYRMVPNSCTT